LTKRIRLWGGWAAGLATVFAACGGEGGPVQPPPPPPPPPGPAITLDLDVGESVTLTDAAEIRSFGIAAAADSRGYNVIVQNTSESFSGSFSGRLAITAQSASPSVVDAGPSRVRRPGFSAMPRHLARRQNALAFEDRLRRNTRAELDRRNARPSRGGAGRASGAQFSVASAPPVVGDDVTFKLAVTQELQVDCNSSMTIDSKIKWVGQNFAIAEDVQSAGHFTQQDYDDLGQLLDQTIYPIQTAYFGEPADIDGNGVVIALITAEVNRMTPRNASFLIAGFFFDGDLFDPSDCAASNEGELFYLIGPDPSGTYSDNISIDEAVSLARTTVGHEFLHLLNTQQRITIGGGGALADEDAWLDEGLAHFAEELVGLAVANRNLRSNLDLDGVSPPGDLTAGVAFNDFHLLNLQRAARFMLDPEGTRTLGNSTGGDPSGAESLKMRGFGYLFARWLGDQYGPAGSGPLPGAAEDPLFRELSTGGPGFLSGTANVERAVQVVGGQARTWSQLLADFLGMLATDDRVTGTDPELSSLTWNYNELFRQLSEEEFVDGNGNPVPPPSELQNPYPLIPAFVSLNASTNTSRNVTLNPSTGAFFELSSSGAVPEVLLQFTSPSGEDIPGSLRPQVTVIRIR
jgi:hypothetical protein